MQRQEVRGAQHVVGALGLLGADLAVAAVGDERVERDHAHAEGLGADGDELADAAEAQDAERLALELGAAELAALPLAAREARVRLRDVAGEGQDEGDRVLGGGDRVGLRRVGDDDARFFEAVWTSTLSTPTPARPTTLEVVRAVRTSASSFVALRIRMPWKEPMRSS